MQAGYFCCHLRTCLIHSLAFARVPIGDRSAGLPEIAGWPPLPEPERRTTRRRRFTRQPDSSDLRCGRFCTAQCGPLHQPHPNPYDRIGGCQAGYSRPAWSLLPGIRPMRSRSNHGFLQPPDPPEDGHCLSCGAFVIRDEQRAGVCIDCQPAEDGEHPAFPVRASEYGGHGTCFGMSLRDYFAAKAMNAAVSACAGETFADNLRDRAVDQQKSIPELVAFDSYAMADAMLAARAK